MNYADLAAAVADPTVTVFRASGTIAFFQPLIIKRTRRLVLDLTGARLIATNTFVNAQLMLPALINLEQCANVDIIGGDFVNNGFGNAAIGLRGCTDCTITGATASGSNIGFGQFWSLGGTRIAWRYNTSKNGLGTARGYWLGNNGEGETDLEVIGCKALSMPATGFAIGAVGAKIIGNTSNDNQGAGICSGTSSNTPASRQTISGNLCQRNLFWGWQSDVWGDNLADISITGNVFMGNKAGSAMINLCRGFIYSDNVEDGVVQVIASQDGIARIGKRATLAVNGPVNVNVTIA